MQLIILCIIYPHNTFMFISSFLSAMCIRQLLILIKSNNMTDIPATKLDNLPVRTSCRSIWAWSSHFRQLCIWQSIRAANIDDKSIPNGESNKGLEGQGCWSLEAIKISQKIRHVSAAQQPTNALNHSRSRMRQLSSASRETLIT